MKAKLENWLNFPKISFKIEETYHLSIQFFSPFYSEKITQDDELITTKHHLFDAQESRQAECFFFEMQWKRKNALKPKLKGALKLLNNSVLYKGVNNDEFKE